MSTRKWSYKTVHFELKREGLLGGSFLDEAEIEEQLNDFGRSGWELISVIEVQDGIIAFFKQSLDLGLSSTAAVNMDAENDALREAEEDYGAREPQEAEDVTDAHQVREVDDVYDDEVYKVEDQNADDLEPCKQEDDNLEEEDFTDDKDNGYAFAVSQDDYDEIVEVAEEEGENQETGDEQQENDRGIGAIRIE